MPLEVHSSLFAAEGRRALQDNALSGTMYMAVGTLGVVDETQVAPYFCVLKDRLLFYFDPAVEGLADSQQSADPLGVVLLSDTTLQDEPEFRAQCGEAYWFSICSVAANWQMYLHGGDEVRVGDAVGPGTSRI